MVVEPFKFYPVAFVVREHVNALVADLGGRGWVMVARMVEIHFTRLFITFLDAPTMINFDRVFEYETDVRTICAKTPGIRPGRQ
jgi:hypothetical protein